MDKWAATAAVLMGRARITQLNHMISHRSLADCPRVWPPTRATRPHTRTCVNACEVEMWNRLQEALHRVSVGVFEYTQILDTRKRSRENRGYIKIGL